MLPILFKLDFNTPAQQLLALAIAMALAIYGAWAGARGAPTRESAPWRAGLFASVAALAVVVGAAFAFPLMSPSLATGVQIGAGVLIAIMVVCAAIFGRKASEPVQATSTMLTYGAMAAAVGFVAFKFGLSVMGRDYGAPLHTYGFAMAMAFVVAMSIAAREAKRAYPELVRVDGKQVQLGQIMRDRVLDLGFWLIVAGIAGSKILFAIVNWDLYSSHSPLQILGDIAGGGLVFYGGFIAAAATAIWFCRHHKINFLRIADVLIPSVAIGHAIGRLGCLSAGCCWGGFAKLGSKIAMRFPSADHLPFGGFGTSSIPYGEQLKDTRWVDAVGHVTDHMVAGAHQISAVAQSSGYSLPVYPVQLMESLGEMLLFFGLIFLRRYKSFHGQLMGTWLICYSILRATIEFFRGDLARGYLFRYPAVEPVLLSTSQLISLGIFLAGVSVFVLFGRGREASIPVRA